MELVGVFPLGSTREQEEGQPYVQCLVGNTVQPDDHTSLKGTAQTKCSHMIAVYRSYRLKLSQRFLFQR